MMRNSRREDSKREENSAAERFSKIIPFEPALGAANRNVCPLACVIGIEWSRISLIYAFKSGGTANNLRPF